MDCASRGSFNPAPRFTNWLGNVTFAPQAYFQPTLERHVVSLVRRAAQEGRHIRVIGAGHSWSPVCATDGYLVNLDYLDRVLHIDRERLLVTVEAGIRLRELIAALAVQGLALINLGSIAEQSLAGAISTGTHGTGIRFGNLATQVEGLRLVNGRGEIQEIGPREPEVLDAARVSLGALGILTRITLRVTPAFTVREELFPLPFAEALGRIDEFLQEADHFKLWWFPHAPLVQVYRQFRNGGPPRPRPGNRMLGEDAPATQAVFARLLQAGEQAPWLLPLIHRFINRVQFQRISRVDQSHRVFNLAMPPPHHESEYAIPVGRAAAALFDLRHLIRAGRHRVNFVSEVRFVGKDTGWLSPSYQKDVCYIGAYSAGERSWERYLHDYEHLMLRHGGRPHWGKEFTTGREQLRPLYPMWDRFCQLRRERDPAGVFLNPLLERLFPSLPEHLPVDADLPE